MAVSHVKSDAIADATGTVTIWYGTTTATVAATDLVRPGDWNSAHNQFYTLTGNTTGNSTASGTNVLFSASGNLTLGGSTNTIVFIGPPLMSVLDATIFPGATGTVGMPTATSAIVSLYPFVNPVGLAAGIMNVIFSVNFLTVGTSSGRQSVGMAFGIYTRGTGTNSTTMGSFTTTSVTWGVTGNNSSYTINQQTSTDYTGYGAAANTNSAGVNITSQYTGLKVIGFPINATLTPGQYYLAWLQTNSTSSVNVGMSMTMFGLSPTASQFNSGAPMGSLSSAYSLGNNNYGFMVAGMGSWSSAGSVTGLPASMAFTSITRNTLLLPIPRFWST